MTSPHLVPSFNSWLRHLPAPQCLPSTSSLPTPHFPRWLLFPSTPFFHLLLRAALSPSSRAASYPAWLMLCSPLAVSSFPFSVNAFPSPFAAWNLLGLAVPPAFPLGCLFPLPSPSAAAHCFSQGCHCYRHSPQGQGFLPVLPLSTP